MDTYTTATLLPFACGTCGAAQGHPGEDHDCTVEVYVMPLVHPSVAAEAQELRAAWEQAALAVTPGNRYSTQAEDEAHDRLAAFVDDNDLWGTRWDPTRG